MLEFAIVGAGFGGLAMGLALQRAGVGEFLVLEKADRVGGTWRENQYPGAACDVPSHLYSLAQAPNAGWTRMFPQQPEIQAHLERSAAALVAAGRVCFGWQLVEARWDAQQGAWALLAGDGRQLWARHLVMALGGLHVPAYAAIERRGVYAGVEFHSARWRHDVDLRGRRVVVIGTGASAIQFIPEIAAQGAQLTVLQRSAPWILPRPDFAIAPFWQAVLARVPALRLALRGGIFLLLEVLSHGLLDRRLAGWARWLARRHREAQVADPALRARLTPDYAIGCKRVLISSNYYPALQRPNVQLESTPAAAIEAGGVRLADGRLLEAEVLIHGTGFRPLDVLSGLRILGRAGRELAVDWGPRPQAHLGIGVHGYPNLHFLLGPNTALGHNSVLYMIECQVRHILALHAARQRRGAQAVEPTLPAQQAFMAQVDRGFAASAWADGCHSWYLDSAGHNIALWTRTCLAYRWRTRLDEREYSWSVAPDSPQP